MKCIALMHVSFENLGTFESTLIDKGFEIEYRHAGLNPLTRKEWVDTDLIVVLGGPIGVYQTVDYPWLMDEVRGIFDRLNAKMPTLGICLGAQLIAKALNQRVYPGIKKEIGWSQLTLNEESLGTCLEELSGHPVLHWHGDTFDLPPNLFSLASTEITANQAFMIDNYVLALQFHAEVDPTLIEAWLIGHTGELANAGINIPDLRQKALSLPPETIMAGKKMLTRWIEMSF